MIGDTPILILMRDHEPRTETFDLLADLIEANIENATKELMCDSPGPYWHPCLSSNATRSSVGRISSVAVRMRFGLRLSLARSTNAHKRSLSTPH
jgi:hypothetical protein